MKESSEWMTGKVMSGRIRVMKGEWLKVTVLCVVDMWKDFFLVV